MFKWISKLTEKMYLKANPDKAVVDKEHLKVLEDVANTPILPDFHVYERFHTTYIPRVFETARYMCRDEYELFIKCDNCYEILRETLSQEMLPEIQKRLLLEVKYVPEQGYYAAIGRLRFWEREDEC